jgi:RNA polymerase sigma-70 factor (ECF subfamily)
MNAATLVPPGPTAAPALERAFEEYGPRIAQLARRLLGNEADAEDATQDVFVQLARKLSSFRGECAFRTWLYRVVLNAILSYRRKRAAWRRHQSTEPLEHVLDRGRPHRPEPSVLDREAHRLIEAAIAGLPESCREVYVLADVEELPSAGIAERLGLSEAAVKGRLHRARRLMRRALGPHFGEQAA